MKKLFCMLALALLLPVSAAAISAQSAAVLDANTGTVLYAQNADVELPMASTTKIMTALVALEQGNLDRKYTVKKEYTMVEGSSMYLREGEVLTVRDTLYGLLLESGNDAAVAIAGECGGEESFLQKMNEKAAELGLENTHFDNPNGLDGPSHYTTAQELAMIAAAAMQDDTFRQIVATRQYTAGEHVLYNHNRLLAMREDIVGIKTGYTRKSGRCLVSAAKREGRTLVAVTLNDPDDWNDHLELLEQGFSQYRRVCLHKSGDCLGECTVYGGDRGTVPLIAQHTVTALLTPEEQKTLAREVCCPPISYAPVGATLPAGEVAYFVGGWQLAQDTLLFGASSALLPEEKTAAERLWDWLRGENTDNNG